ncbi:MAG: N-acetyltransferase family protein [Bacteroidetes bacterium]|nr:MAG: N-acetyltransferase family protein [Bacteroidota bacterium]
MAKHSPAQFAAALPSHYAAIAEIYNQYILRGNATMDETLKTAADIGGWVEKFHAREALYVQTLADQVIGWGIIKRYSDREGYRFAAETAVYLHADHLGQGHGSTLKRFLIEESRRLNYHHLVAKIFADNQVSIDYNLKLGYTIVGRQKEIGYKNGRWMDVVILQLIL